MKDNETNGAYHFRGVFDFELVADAALVVGLFFAVLHFLAEWISQLAKEHATIYAFVAIALIIGQGLVVDEIVTTLLLRLLQSGVPNDRDDVIGPFPGLPRGDQSHLPGGGWFFDRNSRRIIRVGGTFIAGPALGAVAVN